MDGAAKRTSTNLIYSPRLSYERYLSKSMRTVTAILLASAACVSLAENILLVPLDSRPASGQFAQMIAGQADAQVKQPPYEFLGRFTQPGAPDRIIDWVKKQDLSEYDAVVMSTDMVAYGGLIASREDSVSYERALRRLKDIADLREKYPNVRFYAFSAITRLNPTATRNNANWRLALGRYAEVRERYRTTRDPAAKRSMLNLAAKIPSAEIARYDEIRDRNHRLQQAILRMVKFGAYDFVILGQDDAQPMGPHIGETTRLRRSATELGVEAKVFFAEGIDQHPNVLMSRALLATRGWTPRVQLVYSDDSGRRKVALYESKTIEASLRDQLLASGARPALPGQEADYTVYLNTPNPDALGFSQFLNRLSFDVERNKPVCVADINLGRDGTGDPNLYDFLWQRNRMTRLAAYAGWNTAGNTMGTAIPAANVYLLAKRSGVDPLKREVAQREFLLHRFVNDYQYHKYTRPYVYRMIDASERASREETYGEDFEDMNSFVRRDLGQRLESTFREQFLGKRFTAGPEEYALAGIDHVRIFLPWPRAYEVRLEFKLNAREVTTFAESVTSSAVATGRPSFR